MVRGCWDPKATFEWLPSELNTVMLNPKATLLTDCNWLRKGHDRTALRRASSTTGLVSHEEWRSKDTLQCPR